MDGAAACGILAQRKNMFFEEKCNNFAKSLFLHYTDL